MPSSVVHIVSLIYLSRIIAFLPNTQAVMNTPRFMMKVLIEFQRAKFPGILSTTT